MVCALLNDIEGHIEAQNLPGTTNEHPNWQRRSATPVDVISWHHRLPEIGRLVARNGR